MSRRKDVRNYQMSALSGTMKKQTAVEMVV